MNPSALLQTLTESRLLSDQQLEEVERAVSADKSSQEIVQTLVKQQVFTPYQAESVLDGQANSLVYGKYHILSELGRGGFGRVFEAVHTVMRRKVALKVISPEQLENASARQWFKREVLAATQLSHPNIVMAYDADETADTLYFVMELVDGLTLASLVNRFGPLPEPVAWRLMHQCAMALVHSHEKEMVHRDIKPGNCLIPSSIVERLGAATTFVPNPEDCVIKIADFGLAHIRNREALHGSFSETRQGFLGTPDYVAPEQSQNAQDADIRSDMYSLGCTLYYALTGRKPFKGQTALETVLKHLHEEPAPATVWRPELSKGIVDIVHRLMAKAPADRFQSPRDLQVAIECSLRNREANVLASQEPDLGETSTTRVANSDGFVSPATTSVLPSLGLEKPHEREESPASVFDRPPTPSSASDPKRTHNLWPEPPEFLPESSHSSVADETRDERSTGVRETQRSNPTPARAPVTHHKTTKAPDTHNGATKAPHKHNGSTNSLSRKLEAIDYPATWERFRENWLEWYHALGAVVRGDSVTFDSSAEFPSVRYQQVYTAVLESLRLLCNGKKSKHTSSLRKLEALVEPWANLRSLKTASKQTQKELWESCSVFHTQLGLEPRVSFWVKWELAIMLLMGLAGALGWYLFGR